MKTHYGMESKRKTWKNFRNKEKWEHLKHDHMVMNVSLFLAMS